MAEAEDGTGRRGQRLACLLAALCCAGMAVAAAIAQPVRPAPPAVPVTIAHAVRQDVPIDLFGLGSVQAFNAVLVRARVDGTLMQVPVTEGQEVNQGDVLAIIDPRPFQAALNAAIAKRAQDQADLENAKRDLTRYSSLAQSSFASRQQVDTQQSMVNRLTAMIAGDEAAVETAQLNLGYCTVTSPIQGRVGLRQVDPGNLVHAADANGIMTITQIHPISILFTLPQDTLPKINVAMLTGKLPVTALSSNGATELDQGTLLTPDNTIDASTGTIKLKAIFPNPKNTLWPGQFVNARLLLGTDKNVLTVPSIAVQHGPDNLYVYTVRPDSTVMRQEVMVARDDGTVAIIAKGLSDDQVVVTEGQSRLQQGTKVVANDSAKSAIEASTTDKTGG